MTHESKALDAALATSIQEFDVKEYEDELNDELNDEQREVMEDIWLKADEMGW